MEPTVEDIVNALYDQCEISLSEDNTEYYGELLSQFPIEYLPKDEQKNTLFSFLDMCYQLGSKKGVVETFRVFEEHDPIQDSCSYLTTFYVWGPPINPTVNNEDFYYFVATSFPEIELDDHLISLLNYEVAEDRDESVLEACILIDQIYGTRKFSFYTDMLQVIIKKKKKNKYFNEDVLLFIEYKLRELADVAPVPEWIIKASVTEETLKNEADQIKPNKYEEPSEHSLAMMIYHDTQIDENVSFQSTNDRFTSIFIAVQLMTKSEKKAFVENFLSAREEASLQLNEELFRTYGPSFPVIGTSSLSRLSDNPCDWYGGCRMCLCLEHHANDSDLDGIDSEDRIDWFKGYCEVCFLKIEKRCYAVRIPGEQGGFYGCYCSIEHAEKMLNPESIMQRELMKIIKSDLYTIGIYDRYEEETSIVSNVESSNITFDDLASYL